MPVRCCPLGREAGDARADVSAKLELAAAELLRLLKEPTAAKCRREAEESLKKAKLYRRFVQIWSHYVSFMSI